MWIPPTAPPEKPGTAAAARHTAKHASMPQGPLSPAQPAACACSPSASPHLQPPRCRLAGRINDKNHKKTAKRTLPAQRPPCRQPCHRPGTGPRHKGTNMPPQRTSKKIAKPEQGPAKTAVLDHHLWRNRKPRTANPRHIPPPLKQPQRMPSPRTTRPGLRQPTAATSPGKKGKASVPRGNTLNFHSSLWAGACEDGCFGSPPLAHAARRTPSHCPAARCAPTRHVAPRTHSRCCTFATCCSPPTACSTWCAALRRLMRAHSLATPSKTHALDSPHSRASNAKPARDRAQRWPDSPPLEAAPARAVTAAEPLQRSMQWHRDLTRGSCPSGARSAQ